MVDAREFFGQMGVTTLHNACVRLFERFLQTMASEAMLIQ
jgi:hypothetical protein